MSKEPEGEGFKITDRRHFAAKEPEEKDKKVVAEGNEDGIKEENKKKR